MENNNSGKNGSANLFDNLLKAAKKNSNVIKGAVAVLLGSYLISVKYHVIMDFALFAAGTALVLYGLVCLKVAKVQEFLAKMVSKVTGMGRR